MHLESIKWFNKRLCRIQFIKIPIESLCEVDFEHSILENIELYLPNKTSLQHVEHLIKLYILESVTSVNIKGIQDPVVMEVLFSLLSNSSSVCSLNIYSSNLPQWSEHIKKIGPYLRELNIPEAIDLVILTTITEYCPYLEDLSLSCPSDVILQSITNNCQHLHSLEIIGQFIADADLTAFAEKCPQLEELSLHCEQLTDQSVIALAQHCSRLKKLKLSWCKLTVASLITLSERSLPLEKLVIIPWIPIPSAEIAAQCAHALSRIRKLSTYCHVETIENVCFVIQYMTGLRELNLCGSEDHLLVPHLLLLLQGQCCAGLESLTIRSGSSITPQQLCELVAGCQQLHTLIIYKPNCTSDAVLVELARSCPHLQEVGLYSSELTEEGVLALGAHCRQLRVISIGRITVTEETVRQLAQHCRRLTYLEVELNKFEVNRIGSLH